MKINVSKTMHLRITFGRYYQHTYTLLDTNIETVKHYRHLGVNIDEKLSYYHHVNHIVSYVYKKWAFLKKISKDVDGKVYLRLYQTYILPIIDYCN